MKVYTGTGDAGQTSLYSGERVAKTSLRVQAYGTMDELQAALGLARASISTTEVNSILHRLEELLVGAMAQLATISSEERIGATEIAWIEECIDSYTPEKFSFRIPGANEQEARLHFARTIARRCERSMLELNAEEPVGEGLLVFVNRVSDLCYVLACAFEEE